MAPERDAPPPRRTALAALLLVVATLVAYAGVRENGFAPVDDDVYVTANPWVLQGLSRDGLVWALTESHGANWHPLTWLSHMLDVELFGTAAGAHHLVNVLLHAASAALLFVFLARSTGTLAPSAFAAAVFALHPLRVESVAWIAERKDVLAGLLGVLTLLAYARYARRPSAGRYGLVALLFALGLTAKPMLVTLPCVLLLVDLWPLRRWSPGAGRPVRFLVLEKLPLLALAGLSSWVTYASQVAGGAVDVNVAVTSGPRVANALESYGIYAWKTLWPTGLAVFHPHRAIVAPDEPVMRAATLAGLALVVLLLALAAAGARRRPWLTVGLLWYLGMLVPVIGLVQVGEQAWAERYAYLPTVGLVLAATWSAAELADRVRAARLPLGVLAAATLVGCLVATRAQVARWRDGVTLLEHALAVTERNAPAHVHLARALEEQGDLSGALEHLRAAVAIVPRDADALNNLGLTLGAAGELAEAEASLRRALELEPEHARAWSNLGILLARAGRGDEALDAFRRATEAAPGWADGWRNRGVQELALGRPAEAARSLEEALRLSPLEPELWRGVASARGAGGDRAGAAQALRRAVALAPEDPAAANELARALATRPETSPEERREALELARRAVAATGGRRAAYLATLAAAHAALGEFEAAARAQERAVERAAPDARPALEAILTRYRAGQALWE